MRLADISVNNLKRRKAKMLFVVLGLTVAVSTAILLVTITNTTKTDMERKLDEFGANILISPKTDALSLSYGGITVQSTAYDIADLTDKDAASIMTIKNKESISAIAPKLVGVVKAEKQDALLVGVRFIDELKVKKWWSVQGSIPSNADEVVLGSRTAAIFQKAAGDSININDKRFIITGILKETGEQDDSLIFADLSHTQTLLGKQGKLSLIEISALCSTCPIEEIDAQISKKLPHARVATIQQAVKSKMESIDQLRSFTLILSIILSIIGTLIVLITMMASVNERLREIGIFRAIGFRRSHIARIIVLEAIIVSFIGGLLGYAVGLGAAMLISPRITQLSVPLKIDVRLFAAAIVLSVTIGIIGSIYPAMRASKLDPANALRTI